MRWLIGRGVRLVRVHDVEGLFLPAGSVRLLMRPGHSVGNVCGVNEARVRNGAMFQLLGAVILAGTTVAVWWLWLGTDTRYEIDPVTGARTGPYEPGQVVGCVLSLLVIAVVGGLLWRPWIVVVAMTVAFTVAWSMAAASEDATGLWGVGAVLVAVGMAGGSAVFSFGARLVRTVIARRS